VKQHAGKTEPLLLRDGEHRLPVLHYVETPGPFAEPRAPQRRIDVLRRAHAEPRRVANGAAQRTYGYVRPVGGDEGSRVRRQRHRSGAPWPEPCAGEKELVADWGLAVERPMLSGGGFG